MKTAFLITVRLKSTRLPGKALLDLNGRPVLAHLISRLRNARRIDHIVISTSTDPQDDPLVAFAEREGVACFRGDPEDVIVRLAGAGRSVNADYLLNITADCPLVDPVYADRIVERYERKPADLIRTLDLPHGAFSYGIAPAALERVIAIKGGSRTEVWGRYFTDTDLFSVVDLPVEPRHHRPDVRLTLDYPEDLEVLRRALAATAPAGGDPPLDAVLAFLDAHPEVAALNRDCADRYRRRWTSQGEVALKPRYEVRRAAVIGCGSIGQRHVRNLQRLGVTEIVALKGHPGHTRALDPALGIAEVNGWSGIEAFAPDIAIVANPSSLHVSTACAVLPMVRGLFIEKPVALTRAELDPLLDAAARHRVNTFVGHVLTSHPIAKTMRERLNSGELGEPLALQAQAGQYLPDWHPSEDYRRVYYARADLGGGVLRSLIHEPHLAVWLLGAPLRVAALCSRAPGLEADVDGLDDLMIEHDGGARSQVHLDYLQRPYSRSGTLICSRGVMLYDFAGGSLMERSTAGPWRQLWSDAGYDMNQAFLEQMQQFLRYVSEGRVRHEHDVFAAAVTAALVDAAESAARSQRFEPVAKGS
jgi:spore coat polysaccharide biosynthesis protein SpsF